MVFSFGFSNDDIESDDGLDVDGITTDPLVGLSDEANAPPHTHNLEDLLASLPERLSYSTIRIESPLGRVVRLPRRELYDIRTQLLAEGDKDDVVDQLEKSDISKGVYEGGFKTWECSIDLASLLLDRGLSKDIDDLVRCGQIIELGVGTALPSLILFRHALANSVSGLSFILADYNEEVLRLVTLPNLLLTWAACSETRGDKRLDLASEAGDLEITPELLKEFRNEISALNIDLVFLSGAWSLTFIELIPDPAPDMGVLVLAAETIYSPASTTAFVDVLTAIIGRVKMGKAMIGAKRMYFGVGGSVDGFKEACREENMVANEIENHGVLGMDNGVGRALLEVQKF